MVEFNHKYDEIKIKHHKYHKYHVNIKPRLINYFTNIYKDIKGDIAIIGLVFRSFLMMIENVSITRDDVKNHHFIRCL